MLPTLFYIGPVPVRSYGTLLMAGFIAGILLARRQANRAGIPPDTALDLGLWVLIGGLVAARVVFAALNWRDFSSHPVEVLYVWRVGGLSFHGGLLGGIGAVLLLAWQRRQSFWSLADIAAPSVALGYGITRIGCFLNGCCYGRPTSLPWAVRFPLFLDSDITTEPSHPVQIYAAIGSFAILGLLFWARPRLRVSGQLFLLYLVLYAVLRAGLEVLRAGYTAQVLVAGLTQAQVASVVMLVAGLIGMVWLQRRQGRAPRPGRAGPP